MPGRLYPIELEYCPLSEEEQGSKTERLDPRPYVRIMQRIDHKVPYKIVHSVVIWATFWWEYSLQFRESLLLNYFLFQYPDTERGDVLMFLSGMKEIMSVVDATKGYAQKTKRWIILPLHSSLSVAEQDKVCYWHFLVWGS